MARGLLAKDLPQERRLSHESLKLVPVAAAILIAKNKLREKLAQGAGKWRHKLARPDQLEPDEPWWFIWLIMAGRGWGKTRTGAEWCAEKARKYPGCRIALVAATIADVRDTMVEGDSGLLSVFEEHELRGGSIDAAWNRTMCELYLANGSRFKGYTSERPRQLRGPQHHFAWGDEPAYWTDCDQGTAKDTTWTNLKIGTRLPARPDWPDDYQSRIVLTTTPRMVKLIKNRDEDNVEERGLTQDPMVIITHGKTDDNLGNLSSTYRATVIDPMRGSRLARQELEGELIEDVEGALWKYNDIARKRVQETPELFRIVVAVDPAVTANEDSDETGIVTVGTATCMCNGSPEVHAFVLSDRSGRYTPDQWAYEVNREYDEQEADRVVAEVNNGGDLVQSNIKTVNAHLRVKMVRASRGKQTRAEPVASLYAQGKVHHLGVLAKLEDQMTTWVPGVGDSPDRVDALVWAITELILIKRQMKLS